MAAGPNDPSGSPERSGAGPDLQALHKAQHSPLHPLKDAVAH